MRAVNGVFALAIAILLVACGQKPDTTTIRSVGRITVDDTLTLAQMVKAGHYDGSDEIISTTNFPILRKDSHTQDMSVLTFNRPITSDAAVALILARKEDLRPANLDECLAYGAALEKARLNYDLARPNRTITCLGQTANVGGARLVPVIWSVDNGAWDLGTDNWNTNWNSRHRFLVVAKQ